MNEEYQKAIENLIAECQKREEVWLKDETGEEWGYVWLVGADNHCPLFEVIKVGAQEGAVAKPELVAMGLEVHELATGAIRAVLDHFLKEHFPELAKLPVHLVGIDDVGAAEFLDEIVGALERE